uniref:Ribosomal protein S7 n=1 Tax=Helicosporidium sp. subsp. Simulium jonesii TaxID=145475 RepID=D3IZW4_HELSJ|nr:ribosomal protein S7 [Helicosporidium sp. ex Simulium jonesi]ACT36190.1 ribosomal protein S7 [Helicosporidium sp. ex Simulium jonesi]
MTFNKKQLINSENISLTESNNSERILVEKSSSSHAVKRNPIHSDFFLHNLKEVNLAMEHNYYIHKFLNKLMIDGKKSKAFKIMNEAFDIILTVQAEKKKDILSSEATEATTHLSGLKSNTSSSEAMNQDVFHLFLLAIENVTPYLDVRKVRKSGTTLLVPYAITPERGIYNAFCWLIEAAREKRRNHSRRKFSYYLAEEIILASQKTGKAREKRHELHKTALANRSNTKYRWW